MGVSDPEIQKKVFGPRWQHEVAKQVGRSGKGSFIVCNAAPFAGQKHNVGKIKDAKRLLAVNDSGQSGLPTRG